MSKVATMREAVAEWVPDGSSVALGLQMEQMIPFAAGHEVIRQKKRGLTLIGPISDILFDQMIAAGCVERIIAAWVGNVMMGSAYNFRRAVEQGELKIINLSNFTVALALQASAMGVPFLPTRTALGSDVARDTSRSLVRHSERSNPASLRLARADEGVRRYMDKTSCMRSGRSLPTWRSSICNARIAKAMRTVGGTSES
jgi:glutaconate CoA-transferase, subunit A